MKRKLLCRFFFPLALLSFILFSCETTEDQEDSAPVTTPQQSAPSAEYSRSVSSLNTAIPEETFHADKDAIMKAIADLERIMSTQNVVQWRRYLSPSSIAYLSNQNNLRAVSAKHPLKTLLLTDVDYFKYVFIPSRQGYKIDEIRYLSPTEVKAVQVQVNKDIVYYYFEKVNGVWLVKIDESHK